MVKNRYVGRTFIQPSQTLRQRGVAIKLNPLREQSCAASAWSSSTTRSCVARPRARSSPCCGAAGAAEVHLRISAPPIYHPCFYGIDTQIETRADRLTHERR